MSTYTPPSRNTIPTTAARARNTTGCSFFSGFTRLVSTQITANRIRFFH